MLKPEFLSALRDGLNGLPQEDIDERVSFYGEMIDDRMEEGMSEADAVAAVGSVEDIIAQIAAEVPLVKLVIRNIRPQRQLKAWEIVLLAVGSPVWIPLLLAALAIIFSLYVSLWAVIVSLWAVFVSVIAFALVAAASGIGFAVSGQTLTCVVLIGGGVACVGLAVFLFFGCKAATKSAVLLAKKMVLGVKKCFLRKGEA